jgi:hypothetical protein
MSKDENIYKNLDLAKIESEVELCQERDLPLSVVKFKYIVDYENTFLFRNIFKEIYKYLNFPLLTYGENDSFLLFLRGYKLHKSIVTFKKVQTKLSSKFGIQINDIGISEMDKKDSAKDLLDRAQKYLVVSKRVSKSKIIYGTRQFDFYNTSRRADSLKVVLSANPKVEIYNLYQGIPIKDEGVVVGYEKKVICLRISRKKIAYLQNNEKFLYIKHRDFPNIIKAEIAKFDINKEVVCVKNIEFQDDSPVDRENIRVTPPKVVKIMIEYEGNIVADGEIKNISLDSVVVTVSEHQANFFRKNKKKEFVLRFRLFAKNSMMADNIAVKAISHNVIGNDVVFLTKPDASSKTKIAGYIATLKEEIIKNLKIQNRL